MEENLIPELVIEPEEGRLETQRGEVPEAAVMVDRWRSVIRSAMELKITLKAMASAIEGSKRSFKSKCRQMEFNQTIEVYKRAGWIEEDELSAEGEAPVATAAQLRNEEALVEDARQMFKRRLHALGFLAAKFRLWQNRDGQTAGRDVEKIGGIECVMRPSLVRRSTQNYKRNFTQSLQGAVDGGI